MLSIQAPLGKKYKCSTCDVSFDRPFLLQFHLRTSHGIGAPVKCQYCTRADFAHYVSYHNHQLSCAIRFKKKLKHKKKMNTNTRLKKRLQATAAKININTRLKKRLQATAAKMNINTRLKKRLQATATARLRTRKVQNF